MARKKDALDKMPENHDPGFGFFDDHPFPSAGDRVASEGDCESLALGYELTIRNVRAFKEKLDASLASNRQVILDPAELQEIDTAGVQLLFSLQRSLAKTGQSLRWASKNPVIDSAATILGLDELVGDGGVIDGGVGKNDSSEGFGFF